MTEEDETIWLSVLCARHVHFGHDTQYMVKRRAARPGRLTFLNHAPDIAGHGLFVVTTVGFDLLDAFVIVRIDRRDLVWIDVAKNPTAEWLAH